MDTNETDVEKSIGRHRSDEKTPSRDTCIKPWCEAYVNTRIIEDERGSAEIKRCAKGHFVRRRRLDHDGSAYRVFKAVSIMGP